MILDHLTSFTWSFISFFLLFSFTKAEAFTSLQAKETFSFTGNAGGDSFGYSVSHAGDFNNDGYDDIILGASAKNSLQGAAYVIYGGDKSNLANIDLSVLTLDPLKTGFMIKGATPGDNFGSSVSSAGDINNDGYDDIIIGASGKENSKGAAYVIYGGPKSSLSNIDLSTTSLNPPTTGFIVKGNTVGDNLGYSVSGAGDINNDGYADIIIGASGRNSNQGAAYVIYGGPKSSLSNIDLSSTTLNPPTTGFFVKGSVAGDSLGCSVSSAGDVNNDGYDDIIIGASGKTSFKGATYVIYGGPKLTISNFDLQIATLNPSTTGFMITGSASGDYFGYSVSNAGDINKNGYDDLIIGAYGANSKKGKAYIVYGGAKSAMKNIDLSTPLDSQTGFMITGNAANDNFGVSVSCAGDINKDGYHDIVIGALVGKAYIIYGRSSGFADIDLSSPTTATGFIIPGASNALRFGKSVASVDINHDGFSDILIGAYGTDSNKGSAYLMIYNECPSGCKTCSSTSVCDVCLEGYALASSQCRACPSNCRLCSVPNLCDECSSAYYLFQAQCVSVCPSSTFPTTGGICQSCPAGCRECTSDSACQACTTGFTLSESKSCIIQQEISEKEEDKGTKGSAGAFEGTSLFGSSLSSGSSLPLNFGMVAKILRNVKYLNVTVSPELARTFYSWKVTSSFLSAPKSWSLKSESKNLPEVFSRYGLSPVFLINFWKPFLLSLIGLAIFLIFKISETILAKNNDQKNILYPISKHVNIAASNFALTQFYSNLDDVFLYFIIEMRSTEFDTGFRVFSTILAIILLMVGSIFIGLHSKLLNNYQALKAQKTQTGSATQLEAFVAKYQNIRLIMRDFKDITLLTQSFLLINLARSVISSLIFAILFDYPLLQITFLFILNILMITYLLTKRPFKELFDTCGQLFCEVILLIANICIFILAVFDHAESYPIDSITRLSQCIIVLNYILLIGCAVLLVINIGKILYTSYQEKKKVQTVTPEVMTESAVRIINNCPNMMNQSEIMTHSTYGYDKNPLETGRDTAFDNQNMPYSHRLPIVLPANNITEEDLSQSNMFANNVFHSSQFVRDHHRRRLRGITQRISGMEVNNSSYGGFESRLQDYSGVTSQEHTHRTDVNLVDSSAAQWGMHAPGNFMPKRKIRR